jgi:hypothetical protein
MSQPSANDAPLFDLTLTEEQQLTRDSMQRFANSELRELSRQVDDPGSSDRGLAADS